jgi:hypothetical protein
VHKNENYHPPPPFFYIICLTLLVAHKAQAECTKEQIGAMIKNGLSQEQVDNACKNTIKPNEKQDTTDNIKINLT